MKRLQLPLLLFSLSICFLTGVIGSFFTFPSIASWYMALVKPAFNPPNWVFGPVWTVLYFMMGIALYIIQTAKAKKRERREAVQFFASQLIFNVVWSVVFFGLHRPSMAFGAIIALWLLILFTIIRTYPIHKMAALLLVPYILWVSFASLLNFYIAILNG